MAVFVSDMLLFTGDKGKNDAFACSCEQPKPPRDSLDRSTAVFMGNATSVTRADQQSGQKVTFDVDKAWKGISKDIVIVTTADNEAACGYTFDEGTEYVVYAHGGGEEALAVSLCSRTTTIAEAYEDLAALGTGYEPEHEIIGGNNVVSDPYSYGFPAILGVGAAIAGIIAFLTLRKRK